MSLDDRLGHDTVDPEIRARIHSLVSAVGGLSVEFEGRYILGDDALGCLKDIRRWLRIHDQRLNRHDVARCLAEANVVKGDLCEIMALWSADSASESLKYKAALAALEILVPITWPLQLDHDAATFNHHRHIPYLHLQQTKYKQSIIEHKANILNTAIRLALPGMKELRYKRSHRDNTIISVVLYLLRNIALIRDASHLRDEARQNGASQSATINAFHIQDVFPFILTIASEIGDRFVDQDVILMEVLFHLLKGVDVHTLFLEDKRLLCSGHNELRRIMQKEHAMLIDQAKHAPTRHSRFGTMIWVKRDNEKMTTVSGPDVFTGTGRTLQKMDEKRWNKPRRTGKRKANDSEFDEFDIKVPLDRIARENLRGFVGEFLDSSFNPLFRYLRKTMESEADRVLHDIHPRQFCYLVSWFLQAESARRADAKKGDQGNRTAATETEGESFHLIAAVMNQETFIFLNRFIHISLGQTAWRSLNAAMKCFTQILRTVQEMATSTSVNDQDIAENIQNRIFYEHSTHDCIIALLRSCKDQGIGYLDACTEVTHVFMRMLERYSKQNVDLQIGYRGRARRKTKATTQATDSGVGDENHSDGEDATASQRTTSERKFDFARFQARFVTQSSVDAFVAFIRHYNDLSVEQLKRAHRFFYRVAFKLEMGVMLYRIDILSLFNKMIMGPETLDRDLPCFNEWDQLVKQVFRRCIKKVGQRPELFVEMLFSKGSATAYYLENGHERPVTLRMPRPPAGLQVIGEVDQPGQVGIAASRLITQGKSDDIFWIKRVLSSAAEERDKWAKEQQARKAVTETTPLADDSMAPSITVVPDNDERRAALFEDGRLRFLLRELGFTRIGPNADMDASWLIPPSLTSGELRAGEMAIQQAEWKPASCGEHASAENMLRNQRRRYVALKDTGDVEGNGPDAREDEELSQEGGPTAREAGAAREAMNKRLGRMASRTECNEKDRETIRESRRQKDLEKRQKIKSALLVHPSDDETDEDADREFFAAEEQRRLKTAGANTIAAANARHRESRNRKREYILEGIVGRKRPRETKSSHAVDIISLSPKRKPTPHLAWPADRP